MRFYFNMDDEIKFQPKESYTGPDGYCPDAYWDERTIRQIRVVPATPELDRQSETDDSPWWPVYAYDGFSSDFKECKDLDEAYDELCTALNGSIYEYRHDL